MTQVTSAPTTETDILDVLKERPLTFDPFLGKDGHPKLRRCFTEERNPNEHLIAEKVLQWCLETGIINDTKEARDEVIGFQLEKYASRVGPTLGVEQLAILAQFGAFVVLYDDHNDQLHTRDPESEESLRLIEDRACDIAYGSPVRADDDGRCVALADLIKRAKVYAHPSWMKKFAYDWKQFVDSSRWERQMRQDRVVPPLHAFLKMRAGTGAFRICLDFVGMLLPSRGKCEYASCFLLQQMVSYADHQVIWINDIIGVNTDCQDGVEGNIVVALKNSRGLTWDEAVDCAINMVNDEIDGFIALEKEVEYLRGQGELSNGTAEFINCLKSYMRGSMEWSAETDRYKEWRMMAEAEV
nr:TS-C2 [Plocamium pacificum]